MNTATNQMLDMSEGELPGIADHFEKERAAREAAEIAKYRQQNRADMLMCWPEYEGPRIADDVSGWIEVEDVGIYQWAPAKIVEILPGDGSPCSERFRVIVWYQPGSEPHCLDDNGTELVLDWEEIWVPCAMLWELHNTGKLEIESPPK